MRNGLLFFGDLILLYASLLVTLLLRYGSSYQEYITIHLIPFTLLFIFWCFIFYSAGLFDLTITKNNIQFFRTLLTAITISIGISIAFFYLIPSFGITPKTNLFIFSAIVIVLLTAWRIIFNVLVIRTTKNYLLIVGNNPQSQELYDYLLAHPQLGYKALGIIDITEASAREAVTKVTAYGNVKTIVFSREAFSF